MFPWKLIDIYLPGPERNPKADCLAAYFAFQCTYSAGVWALKSFYRQAKPNLLHFQWGVNSQTNLDLLTYTQSCNYHFVA